MGKYPKISIVTQCFNREDVIAETIESVLSQNYSNLEYIVIDDGSTDKSWEIIQRYKDKLSYMERLDGNRTTPVPAINHGFTKATGDIFAILCSKNILMPKSLFTIGEVFSTFPHVEWVSGIGLIIDGDGKVISVIPVRKGFYDHLTRSRANIQTESTFWKKSLWERAGGKIDEARTAWDVALSTEFFLHKGILYHLNTIVGAYRKSRTAFSTIRRDGILRDMEELRNEMFKRIPTQKKPYARLYQMLRYLKPILRNIPDASFSRLPFLKEYCHESVKFDRIGDDNRGELRLYKRNPFRTIFPW